MDAPCPGGSGFSALKSSGASRIGGCRVKRNGPIGRGSRSRLEALLQQVRA